MAITSGDGYIAAAKQIFPYTKTAVTTVANTRYSIAQASGTPGSLTLLGPATPAGGLLTDATAGMPTINAFGGGATGYLTRVQWASSVPSRIELWDKIFAVGITSTQMGTLQTLTLSGQPSILSRTPDGAGNGLRIFLEIATTLGATATTIAVTYTNSAGVSGRATGATGSLSGFVAGRWVEMALQAGDSGVQKIDTVVVGGATNTGALNVIIARPLWTNGPRVANGNGVDGIDRTGMPIVVETAALVATVIPDSTSTGTPDLLFEIANG